MGLSYAGVSLPLATPQITDFLGNYLDTGVVEEFDNTFWAAANLYQLNLPPKPPEGKVELGRLYWPTGACRAGTFHQVIGADALDLIRAAVGDGSSPQSLVMSDQRDGATITVPMYMLPPRPLCQLNTKQLYLLSLVDQRALWRWKNGVVTFDPGTDNWDELYQIVATLLGITFTNDTIAAGFFNGFLLPHLPSFRWVQFNQSLPAILDAVANTVGQRIVVNFDGTVKAVNWDTAKAASDAQWAVQSARKGMSKTAGGQIANADLVKWVPESVVTAFQGSVPPFEVTTTLASLAIPEYNGATGLSGRQETVIADLSFDGATVPPNTVSCQNYAVAAATAWYGWALADLDVTFPGVVNWAPTGWEDAVAYEYKLHDGTERVLTRLIRGPWMDFNSGAIPNDPVYYCGVIEPGGIWHTSSASDTYDVCVARVPNIPPGYYKITATAQVGLNAYVNTSPPTIPGLNAVASVELYVTNVSGPGGSGDEYLAAAINIQTDTVTAPVSGGGGLTAAVPVTIGNYADGGTCTFTCCTVTTDPLSDIQLHVLLTTSVTGTNRVSLQVPLASLTIERMADPYVDTSYDGVSGGCCVTPVSATKTGANSVRVLFGEAVTQTGSVLFPAGGTNAVTAATQAGSKTFNLNYANPVPTGSTLSVPAGPNGIASVGGGLFVCEGSVVVEAP